MGGGGVRQFCEGVQTYCYNRHSQTVGGTGTDLWYPDKKISSVEDSSSDKVITRKAFLDWYTDWLFGEEPAAASAQGVGEPLDPINLFHALASQAASQAKGSEIVRNLTEALVMERDERHELQNQVEELKTVVHEMKSKIEL